MEDNFQVTEWAKAAGKACRRADELRELRDRITLERRRRIDSQAEDLFEELTADLASRIATFNASRPGVEPVTIESRPGCASIRRYGSPGGTIEVHLFVEADRIQANYGWFRNQVTTNEVRKFLLDLAGIGIGLVYQGRPIFLHEAAGLILDDFFAHLRRD